MPEYLMNSMRSALGNRTAVRAGFTLCAILYLALGAAWAPAAEIDPSTGNPSSDSTTPSIMSIPSIASSDAPPHDSARVYPPPEWTTSAIWYEIHIDRFRNGNKKNDPEHLRDSSTRRPQTTQPWRSPGRFEQPPEDALYGGDLAGVLDKLDYLQDLGVNAICLSPVFEASGGAIKQFSRGWLFVDDGYGVAGEFDKSIAKVDPLDPATWYFNKSDKVLLKLIRECHKRGMRIILTINFNALGADSPVFQDVLKHKQQSPFADWFDVTGWAPFEYRNSGDGRTPLFRVSDNELRRAPSLADHIFAVTRRWMDPNGDGNPADGVDGWMVLEPQRLSASDEFYRRWRAEVRRINPEAFTIGMYGWPQLKGFDSSCCDAEFLWDFEGNVFEHFQDLPGKMDAVEFVNRLDRSNQRYHGASLYAQPRALGLAGGHCFSRVISSFVRNGELNRTPDRDCYQRLKLLACFQIAWPGAPWLVYGDEIGLMQDDYPSGGQPPMWWHDGEEAKKSGDEIQREVFRHYKALFTLRNHYAALRTGECRVLLADDDPDALAWLRYLPDGSETLLILLNNGAAPRRLTIPAPETALLPQGFSRVKTIMAGKQAQIHSSRDALAVQLPALHGVILRIVEDAE